MKREWILTGVTIAVFLMAGGMGAEVAKDPVTSSQTRNLAGVRSLVEAINNRDAAAGAGHFASAATWSRGDGSSVQGRDRFADLLKSFFAAFPDAAVTPTEMLAFGSDTVLLEWVLTGTHLGDWTVPGATKMIPATGRSIEVVGADLFVFNASGEIESDEVRIDTGAMLQQLGATPDASPAAADLRQFAQGYTDAWNSKTPAKMAAFFSEEGSLKVNAGAPAVGREAIADVAESFMTAFPDMDLQMDGLLVQGDRAVYSWTFLGTNTGPNGSGKAVRFSGYEVWRIGADGLIKESRGHFDSAGYLQQLEFGIDNNPAE